MPPLLDADPLAVNANRELARFVCHPSAFLLQRLPPDQQHRALHRLWRFVGRPLMRITFHNWYLVRRLILRLFGARIHPTARIRPSVRISHPWNLTVGRLSAIGDHAVLYCAAPISIGDHCTVSQYTCLSTAAVDHRQPSLPLVVAPITIEHGVWLAADVFVGPGVTIGRDAVVGSRSTVLDDVPPRSICAGDVARRLGTRVLKPIPRHHRQL